MKRTGFILSFIVEELAELLNCGTQKVVRLLKELDVKSGIGLN